MPHDPTVRLVAPVNELHLDGFSLTVLEGPDAGKQVRATTSELSAGTAEGNDLVLHDATVSRHHFSVAATPEGFLLRDLGSSNGTWVGDARFVHGYLRDGARVRVGRTTIRVDQLDEDICEPLSPEDRFGALLGASTSMRRIFAALPVIAKSESTVLLEGETGTGKGVLASAIHEASGRAAKPLVVLDCTAIPQALIESELFGHVKGAFTGAVSDRAGAFEQAHGGTIFIDEIGELPLDMQPKLLRALEERTVKRVGGNQRIKIEARVISATNRDLRAEVNRGTFRADLYYRLNVVRLHIPPLRERAADIEALARLFHAEIAPERPISAELLASFRRQTWPGNIRELRAAVERAVLFEDPALFAFGGHAEESGGAGAVSEPEPGRADDIDLEVPFRVAKERAAEQWEKRYVRALMSRAKGNISEAARLARTDRGYLRTLLRKYGVKTGDEGEEPKSK